MRSNNLNLQDLDGSVRAGLESELAVFRAEHPQVPITLSSIMRMAITEGLIVLKARRKRNLGDKLTGGKLKK